MGDFAEQTNVEGADGRYRAAVSEEWRIWGPMGGYVAAIALRAGAAEVEAQLRPASFTCQYFTPAQFAEVDLEVTIRRATRRTAAVAVSMTQADTPILDAQMWFAAESVQLVHDHAGERPAGPPESYPGIEDIRRPDEEPPFPFWRNFDARVPDWIEDWENYPGGEPRWCEWLQFLPTATFDAAVVEAARLLLLADLPSWPAAVRAHDGMTGNAYMAPNLDLAVQFHRLDDLGGWLLSSGSTPVADRGLIGFRSEVWTADGRLAATGAGQLLTRPKPSA